MSQLTQGFDVEGPGIIPTWTVGDRLRKAREVTGLDQAHFGDAIGISRGSVSAFEVDRNFPRRIILNAWVLATGVPLEWILTGNVPGEPPAEPEATPRPRRPYPRRRRERFSASSSRKRSMS